MDSFSDEDRGSKHTPMIQQYFAIKAEYPRHHALLQAR